MSDLSLDVTAHEGRDPDPPPRFSTAEDVNPPLPGDATYEDYVERRAAWMRWMDEQRAQRPDAALTFTSYFDVGLGRMVTPEDPAPRTGRSSEPVESLQSDGPGHADTSGQERPWQRTDAANAELFAILHGGRVRYDHRRGRWLVWAGDWWRPDETGEVRIMAKETARLRYQDAARIEDLKERTQEAGFALRSEDRYRLEAMLSQARSEPPIADADDRWDADPGLFGVTNGIVDLRTGFERNHLLEDHLIGVGHRALPYQCAARAGWWSSARR